MLPSLIYFDRLMTDALATAPPHGLLPRKTCHDAETGAIDNCRRHPQRWHSNCLPSVLPGVLPNTFPSILSGALAGFKNRAKSVCRDFKSAANVLDDFRKRPYRRLSQPQARHEDS
jgi:hypothetical protein